MKLSKLFKYIEKPFKVNTILNNRYKVQFFLARGGYGYTYIVYDFLKKEDVVLKTLRFHKRLRKKEQQRFQQEQEILQKIEHKSFPSFYDSGFIDGKIPYFTMEFKKGKTLEKYLFDDQNKWNEKQTFLFGLELLELVDYLHSNEIAHRDLHIPNIIMVNNRPNIIDFGLAAICKNNDDSMFQYDFTGIGHILLFLFYSTYEPENNKKETSWQEELPISDEAKHIIKKLLTIEEPFKNSHQLKKAFIQQINLEEE
ncbi:protein kinase domain-containing protein [Niallia sp. 01092]|uniref:protein kinase domain-containing protein n=1 Tax=unclassified Niallia TaxID=2837522 RepID=UPI003FD49392